MIRTKKTGHAVHVVAAKEMNDHIVVRLHFDDGVSSPSWFKLDDLVATGGYTEIEEAINMVIKCK